MVAITLLIIGIGIYALIREHEGNDPGDLLDVVAVWASRWNARRIHPRPHRPAYRRRLEPEAQPEPQPTWWAWWWPYP